MKTAVAFFIAGLLISSAADAADIDGAWANDLSVCRNIFKKNKTIMVAKSADSFGSGFVIDGNKIRGKIANCAIKSRKQDGPVVQIIASCSTDVALSTVQFSLQMDGENKMTRLFPGVPEMATTYVRCRL